MHDRTMPRRDFARSAAVLGVTVLLARGCEAVGTARLQPNLRWSR